MSEAQAAELLTRVARLEAWVEAVHRICCGMLGEGPLCQLDEARGRYGDGDDDAGEPDDRDRAAGEEEEPWLKSAKTSRS